jgi:hypothetical protein
MFWLPLEHSCGCVIEWGCDLRKHGSGSGSALPASNLSALLLGGILYLVQAGLWYRLASPSQFADGKRNRSVALSMPVPATHQPN